MQIANSRTNTEIRREKKSSITDILRKERKWNHGKCSIKAIKGIKRVKDKRKTKNKGNKILANMGDINPTIK